MVFIDTTGLPEVSINLNPGESVTVPTGELWAVQFLVYQLDLENFSIRMPDGVQVFSDDRVRGIGSVKVLLSENCDVEFAASGLTDSGLQITGIDTSPILDMSQISWASSSTNSTVPSGERWTGYMIGDSVAINSTLESISQPGGVVPVPVVLTAGDTIDAGGFVGVIENV